MAWGRYGTVRSVLRQWATLRLAQRAHERWERQLVEAGQSVGTAHAMFVGEGPPRERPDEHETVVQFWTEPPDRLQEETEGDRASAP